MKANPLISFQQAITFSQSLLEQISSGKLQQQDITEAVASILQSYDGARGFFVTYLTGENPLADSPSQEIILGLKTSPDIVSDLLVKNLAMSAAMTVSHRLNNDEAMADSSQRVCRRTSYLIEQLNLDSIKQNLNNLQQSCTTGKGTYQDFLERWGYNEAQKKAIDDVVSQLISL